MTLETMSAVVDELVRRGVDATFEYPGFIAIHAGPTTIHYGDACETLAGDVMNETLDAVETTVESSIPSDSTDVARIAGHIECDARFYGGAA